MGIVKESGWDNLVSFANAGIVNSIAYTPPQTAFLAGKKNLALVFFGVSTQQSQMNGVITATYGNCVGQVFNRNSAGGIFPQTQFVYDYCIFFPLAAYDGVSNILAITSTLGFLTTQLTRSAANGGAGFALTLSNVDLTLNAAPLTTAQWVPWVNQPLPVSPVPMSFQVNTGDWLLHHGNIESVNTALGRPLPSVGTDSTHMPAPISGANAESYASYTVATAAGFLVGEWTYPDTGGSFGTGFNVDAIGFILQDPLPPSIALAPAVLDAGVIVELSWTPTLGLGPNTGTFTSYDVYRNGVLYAAGVTDTVYVDEGAQVETTYTYFIRGHYSVLRFANVDSNSQSVTTEDLTDVFNCDCELVSSFSTLLQLRIRMAIQCGYAAMSANLPAGQAIEFNEYLRTAQVQLYKKFRTQRVGRFFRWTMVPGLRYYGISAAEGECALQLDPLAITWAGFEDLNKAWYRLVEGIPPEYYTRANINFGWPTRYEIRSCIEIFPAPQAAYTLWIKGDIGLAPFAADSDRTTIDDEAVLLFAVANWKTSKGKPGATEAMNQATSRIQDLTARKHGTQRFVPGASEQNPATPPRFLPLGNQQS